MLFQFTHPLRGATIFLNMDYTNTCVSIHTPLAGCDRNICAGLGEILAFQFTHPLRGATLTGASTWTKAIVSIHTPLAGCDRLGRCRSNPRRCFNSHTPCGVRLSCLHLPRTQSRFQFTHPLRGATSSSAFSATNTTAFQFTHPLRGATTDSDGCYTFVWFQFTHPLRGATGLALNNVIKLNVSIHTPLAGCDSTVNTSSTAVACVSIHTPLAGCDCKKLFL